MAITMPLVDCLRILAGHYGRRTSNAALTAGLPIPATGITPNLLIRAAERAGLIATLADRSVKSLSIAPNLPCIVALKDNQACIVWDIRKSEKGQLEFIVQFAETPDDKP